MRFSAVAVGATAIVAIGAVYFLTLGKSAPQDQLLVRELPQILDRLEAVITVAPTRLAVVTAAAAATSTTSTTSTASTASTTTTTGVLVVPPSNGLPFIERKEGDPLTLSWDFSADVGPCHDEYIASDEDKVAMCRGADQSQQDKIVAENTATLPRTAADLGAHTRVITLMTNNDRVAHARTTISSVLPGTQLLPAVDGAKITSDVMTYWVARGMLLGRRYHWGIPNVKRKTACSMSHMKTWHELATAPGPPGDFYLVLEDDALVREEDIAALIELLAALAPYKWDFVNLGQHPDMKETWETSGIPVGVNLQLMFKQGLFGMFGYLLSKRGAKMLMQCSLPLARWQDLVIHTYAERRLCLFTPVQPLVFTLGGAGGGGAHAGAPLASTMHD